MMPINTDYLKYKHYANVSIVVDRAEHPSGEVASYTDVGVPSPVDTLIGKLVKKYPTMKFKMILLTVTARLANVQVFDKDEHLATFAYRHGTFRIEGFRVKEIRERKKFIETVDVNRAFTQLNKILKATTKVETQEASLESIKSGMWHLNSEAENKTHSLAQRLFMAQPNRIQLLRNIEEVAKLARFDSSQNDKIQEVDEALSIYDSTKSVMNPLDSNKALVVTFKHDKYLVSETKDTAEVTTYNSENVPDFIRRAVGMLKLVEDNSIVGNVGYRLERDVYLVILQENE